MLSPLKISQVKVGGEIGRRIDVTIQNNFNKLDLEGDFIKPFRMKNYGDNDGFVGTGMLMDAAVGLAAYARGDEEAMRRKNLLVEEMLKLQEADGYSGMFKPSRRIWGLWDVHELTYITRGWLRDYRLFGNRRALEAACKTADYITDRWGADPDREIDGRTNTVMSTTGVEPMLLDLFKVTGNKKYLDFTVKVRKLPEWDPEIVFGRWGAKNGHAYAHMSRCIAQLKLFRIHKDEKLLESSREIIDFLIHGNGLTITGACGDYECWHNTQEGTARLGETCATAYLIRLMNEMALIQGCSCYGDIMERAMFNSLFAAQSPDGRKIRYFTPFDGNRSYFDIDTYCCPCNFRRIVSEVPKLIFYRTKNGLAVNLYTESSATIDLPSGITLAVRQETDYPNSGKVVLHVDPSAPAEFPLWLRIPAWCEAATVKISGKFAQCGTQENTPPPGFFFKISRTWRPGDLVEVDMPMKLRLVNGRQRQAGCVALMRGPLVFCLDPDKNKNLEKVDLRLLMIDPATIEGPVKDSSVIADGLAYRVKAWAPGSFYPHATNLSLLLTKFTDPNGKAIYFKTPNPNMEIFVDDELTKLEAK